MTKSMLTATIHKRFFRLLRFVRIAPILAFVVLLVLVFSYFHTEASIRLSHAWYTAQFWAYTAFFYCSLVLSKNKWTLIPMLLTFFIAIYMTPLFHYENLFSGRFMIVADIFGVLLFIMLWISTSKILKVKEATNG
jgi:hypothetical protein